MDDGVQLFKHVWKGHEDTWPFILFNSGLDPNICTHIENVIPLFIIVKVVPECRSELISDVSVD